MNLKRILAGQGLIEFSKCLLILNESQKASGKPLRVWAKNQLSHLSRFYPFSLQSSKTFVILYTSGT